MNNENKVATVKVAIVTGAASERGIGFAAAEKLALQGIHVILCDIPSARDALNQRVESLNKAGAQCEARTCDITDESQVNDMVAKIIHDCGGVDILFNNAGVGFMGRFEDTPLEIFDLNYQVNVRGTAAMIKAVLPSMKARGGGSIINNASTGGIYADAYYSAYDAAKFGVVGLTKCLALEMGEHKIRVNAICPGFTDTEMAEKIPEFYAELESCSVEEARQGCYNMIAMKRPGQTQEVADLVAFLAGDQSTYITGSAIPIAGGFPQAL